jgi:hypothetical protein
MSRKVTNLCGRAVQVRVLADVFEVRLLLKQVFVFFKHQQMQHAQESITAPAVTYLL